MDGIKIESGATQVELVGQLTPEDLTFDFLWKELYIDLLGLSRSIIVIRRTLPSVRIRIVILDYLFKSKK